MFYQVQRQVRAWRQQGNGRKMCSARPSWMSISMQTLGYKDTLYNIAIDLPDVLEIDAKNMVVKVEPSVTIGRLSLTKIGKKWEGLCLIFSSII
jgi:delta24-sterol reductase